MIGAHSVVFNADPHTDTTWGPAFNQNPEFANDLTNWWPGNATQTWVWQGGQAVGNLPGGGAAVLTIFASPNSVLKPADARLIRLTMQIDVRTDNTRVLYLRIGYGISQGGAPFVYHQTVINNPKRGIHTVEVISDPTTVPPNYPYIRPDVRLETPMAGVPGPVPPQAAAVDYMRLQAATAAQLTADLSCLVDELAIHHGRDDTDSQPDASSCTLDLSTDTAEEDWPSILEIGGVITVTTTLPTANCVRFVGRVTDINQGWDDAGPDTPDRSVMQLIATGTLADLGRRTVGDTPWPQQLDGARVSAIMAAAGVVLSPATSDPGTVQILARDVDSQPALDLAQSVAADAGGFVWALRSGEIRYADADHRRGVTAALELDACDVLVTPTWQRTTEGLINDVSIGYGVAPEGSDQLRFTGKRADSIQRFGTYGLSATTQLAALADASAMGQLLLTRNSAPVWIFSALPLDVAGLSEADTAALLQMETSDLLSLTGLPAAGSVPTSAFLWVEGWRERLAFGVHELELVVSGYCRTSPPPRWDDVDPSLTWDSMGAKTWDDAACFGPTPDLGRWNDIPASVRWDTVPATSTWNNPATREA